MTDLVDMWGGYIDELAIQFEKSSVEVVVTKFVSSSVVERYRICFNSVVSLVYNRQDITQWPRTELTHIEIDKKEMWHVKIVLWSEPSGLDIMCYNLSVERIVD